MCVCVCVGEGNSELDLGRISPANKCCFSNRMVQRNGWSLLNHDGADGVSRAASWRENGIEIFSRGCVSFSVVRFAVLTWHTPTRLSHEGFITCRKAFGYLARVGLLAQKSAKSNNTSLTFYCVKYFYLSLRCLWRTVGADCRWTFCRAGRQTSKTASKPLNIITSCLCCHSVGMETK